jgi:hypothetical protein
VPPDLDEVEKLASHGLTLDQIAARLGIGSSTLYKKKNELIEFMEAIEKGKATGIGRVANKLFDMAMEGNVTAGWRWGQRGSSQAWQDGGRCPKSELSVLS